MLDSAPLSTATAAGSTSWLGRWKYCTLRVVIGDEGALGVGYSRITFDGRSYATGMPPLFVRCRRMESWGSKGMRR